MLAVVEATLSRLLSGASFWLLLLLLLPVAAIVVVAVVSIPGSPCSPCLQYGCVRN